MGVLDAALRGLLAGEPSRIADHGTRCCTLARAWISCLDLSFHRGRAREAPPTWVAQRWACGATAAPLHWCEIATARTLSGGGAAALAREVWGDRCAGICAVELVEHHHALVYDEAIGRLRGTRVEIWSPRDGAWRRPASGAGNPTLAVRIAAAQTTRLYWGEHRLTPGRWVQLDGARLDLPPAAQPPKAAVAAPAPMPACSQNV